MMMCRNNVKLLLWWTGDILSKECHGPTYLLLRITVTSGHLLRTCLVIKSFTGNCWKAYYSFATEIWNTRNSSTHLHSQHALMGEIMQFASIPLCIIAVGLLPFLLTQFDRNSSRIPCVKLCASSVVVLILHTPSFLEMLPRNQRILRLLILHLQCFQFSHFPLGYSLNAVLLPKALQSILYAIVSIA